jgi:hypothetical protein
MACPRCTAVCGIQSGPFCGCSCHVFDIEFFEPISILAARAGDRIVYKDPAAPLGFFTSDVAMWAVCRVRTERRRHDSRTSTHLLKVSYGRRVVGMHMSDLGVECAEESGNFHGYVDASATDEIIGGRL